MNTAHPEYLDLGPAFTGSHRKLQPLQQEPGSSTPLQECGTEIMALSKPQAAHSISVYLNPPFHTDTSSAPHSFP